jgi:hypothetical protein
MVRLVFRPYTQVIRSICTSEPLRASTRVSSGFTLLRHSSPSFGSQQVCSYSDLSKISRPVDGANIPPNSLSLRIRVWHPNTRILVGLLGPCFKTGRLKPFRQHPKRWCGERPGRGPVRGSQLGCLSPTPARRRADAHARCSPQSGTGHDSRL